jgi:hypothetical protein
MTGENVNGFFEWIGKLLVEIGEVEVDDSVVQELLVGQRLVVVGRHCVSVELAESEEYTNSKNCFIYYC